jgi:superfamily II DNA or RNA helicase
MIQLRPYQEDSVAALRDNFRQKKRRVILCAPTGSGKTVTFSHLVSSTLQKDLFAKVLIVTHRTELIAQASETLERTGVRYEHITAKQSKINTRARCYVGMVKTYLNRIAKYPELLNMSLVIIDEAHYGDFKKLFAVLPDNVYVIGVTATPLSASKNDPLSNYYDAIVNPVQIADLIENGYLCPAVTYAAKIDRSSLKLMAGEYSDASQMDTFAKRDVYAGLISKYLQFCTEGEQYKKTIVFNVNVAHSKAVASEFNQAGIPAVHIDGETDDIERDRAIKAYKRGEYRVICNVGLLNAGFDDPSTECVIMNRATTSVPLWLQSCGRGSRPYPGKSKFIILDMGDNWTELGLWEQPRPWEELWNKKRKALDKIGVPAIKTCPQCEALISISARECPECGHVLPVKEKEPPPEAEFIEVGNTEELLKMASRANWPSLAVPDLEQIRLLKNYAKTWPYYVISDRATTEDEFRKQLRELGKIRGYKRGFENYVQYPYTAQSAQ